MKRAVVVLGGRNPFMTDGAGNLQEAPHLALMNPVTKHCAAVHDPWRLCEELFAATSAALSPRWGPTFLDLPMDVLLARMSRDSAPPLRTPLALYRQVPDPEAVRNVAERLAAASQPVIVAGSGAYWAGAEEALAELAAVADAPVFLNGMARGMLGRNHPLQVRRNRSQALKAADLVLLLGADLDFRLGFGQGDALHAAASVVHVDPDAARIGRNRQRFFQ